MRSLLCGVMTCVLLLPLPVSADEAQPAPRPSMARRAAKAARTTVGQGLSLLRRGWSGLRQRYEVNKGFRQTVKQHPDELRPILAEGRARTRTARRVKWGAGAATLVGAAASFAAPVLIPIALGAGATTYVAHRIERRGIQRARVQTMKRAMLEGHAIPAATEAHYRPLVVQGIVDDTAAAKKTIERGTVQLERMKPGLDRARARARSAVQRYQGKKAPYVRLQDQLQNATSQVHELGRQLQHIEASTPGE
jgi:hypothetical protein